MHRFSLIISIIIIMMMMIMIARVKCDIPPKSLVEGKKPSSTASVSKLL